MASLPRPLYATLRPNAKAKAKGAKRKGHSAGSQPYSAGSQPCLEGVELPPWWPKDHRGHPIHKLYRAMNEKYNELWPVHNRPPDYPDRALTEREERMRCSDVITAIDTGSKETSPFLSCTVTEAGARSYLSGPKKLFCKVNLLTLFQKGRFHQNSFIDLSNEKAWYAFFDKAPPHVDTRLATLGKPGKLGTRRHYDEFLLCWRGELPLEIFEVFTPPLKNEMK